MKKQRKLLFVAMCILSMLFAFVIVSNATEYTVTTNEEFKTAYTNAIDGDTIVIKDDISGTLNFGKSITYIIDGGYTWKAGAACDATGKTVEIYARNGNGVFLPNSNMWCNSYGINASINETVWSFGSLDDSTLLFDMSVTNVRLVYGTNWKEINIKPGTVITNCNNNDMRDTKYFHATTVNIYENTKIYGNYVQAYRGFIHCSTLNIYGGEIYGCYFNEYGMAIANTVNMYGGKIHDIYLNFGNKDVTEGLFNNAAFNMYGGEIYNNYAKGTTPSRHSVIAGNKHIIGGSIHDNYYFTAWTTPTKNDSGVYSSELDINGATEIGNGVGSTKTYDYSVIFKNADSSIISAYLVGSTVKSTNGLTEVTIPEGVSTWSKSFKGCAPTDVILTEQGTYYVTSEHTVVGDKDCTKGVVCNKCDTVIVEPQPSHKLNTVIVYENNNFVKTGTKTETCQNASCEHSNVTVAPALFVFVGYSTNRENTELCASYTANKKAIDEYTSCNKNVTFKYGVVASADTSRLDTLRVENGSIVANVDKTVIAEISGEYIGFDFRLTGFKTLESADEQDTKSVALILSAYVAVNDLIYYVGGTNDKEYFGTQATTLTFYQISNETPPTFS